MDTPDDGQAILIHGHVGMVSRNFLLLKGFLSVQQEVHVDVPGIRGNGLALSGSPVAGEEPAQLPLLQAREPVVDKSMPSKC